MKRSLSKFICFTAVIGVMLSAAGCSSYRNFEENIKSDIASVKQEQEIQERLESKQKAESESAQQTEKLKDEQRDQDTEKYKQVVLDPGIIHEDLGDMRYTVTKATFYSDFEDTGINENDVTSGFKPDEAFILMSVTVENISHMGSYADGSMNVGGTLFLLDRTCEEDPLQNIENSPEDLERLAPEACYFQEHSDGDDYWHILIEIGEKKELHFGFSVPVESQEEAEQYLISWNATRNVSGEIPFVPEGSDKS